jgi:hypothetical protein
VDSQHYPRDKFSLILESASQHRGVVIFQCHIQSGSLPVKNSSRKVKPNASAEICSEALLASHKIQFSLGGKKDLKVVEFLTSTVLYI